MVDMNTVTVGSVKPTDFEQKINLWSSSRVPSFIREFKYTTILEHTWEKELSFKSMYILRTECKRKEHIEFIQ